MEKQSGIDNNQNLNGANENDFYTEQNLNKYLLSSIYRKNWEQRLQWFESKIISFYRNLNKSNILIVGRKSFIDTFKRVSQKYDWNNSNLYFATTPNSRILNKGYDLVIDAKYYPEYFSVIYGELEVQSFIFSYTQILIEETISFLKKNKILP